MAYEQDMQVVAQPGGNIGVDLLVDSRLSGFGIDEAEVLQVRRMWTSTASMSLPWA